MQYLSTAARYKHTAASFLLAQIYYEGRGSKDVPGYFVEPDLAKSFEHFQRIASQHASSSLEAAFDAYSSGNTSLALLLYLLHAEVPSSLFYNIGCRLTCTLVDNKLSAARLICVVLCITDGVYSCATERAFFA